MTEDEKNELVSTYRKLVFKIAYRYSFFDRDIEDIQGWGFLGLAKAINEYELKMKTDPEFSLSMIAVQYIKKEIIDAYRKRQPRNAVVSLHGAAFIGEDGSSKTLEEYLPYEDDVLFDETDISDMLAIALIQESEKDRNLIIEQLLTDINDDQLSKKYKKTKREITKISRKGKAIIKNYLVNNDIIVKNASGIQSKKENRKRLIVLNKIERKDYGKIKFISKQYPYLNANDISNILEVSSYSIVELLKLPTPLLRNAHDDDSIENEVMNYVRKNYPERVPGQIVMQHPEDLQKVN